MIRRSLEPSAMADLNRRLSRRAAAFVDKILKDARSPAICRSEFSTKIEMLRAAQADAVSTGHTGAMTADRSSPSDRSPPAVRSIA